MANDYNNEPYHNLTYQDFKGLVYDSLHEYEIFYHGDDEKHAYMIYHDMGGCSIDTPDDIYHFRTWEEMCQAPVFEGKTIPEAVGDFVVYF